MVKKRDEEGLILTRDYSYPISEEVGAHYLTRGEDPTYFLWAKLALINDLSELSLSEVSRKYKLEINRGVKLIKAYRLGKEYSCATLIWCTYQLGGFEGLDLPVEIIECIKRLER